MKKKVLFDEPDFFILKQLKVSRFNQKIDSNLKILSTRLKQSLSKEFKPLKKFKNMHFFTCKLDSIMLQEACDDRKDGGICPEITI